MSAGDPLSDENKDFHTVSKLAKDNRISVDALLYYASHGKIRLYVNVMGLSINKRQPQIYAKTDQKRSGVHINVPVIGLDFLTLTEWIANTFFAVSLVR